jgi:hypothetical protein
VWKDQRHTGFLSREPEKFLTVMATLDRCDRVKADLIAEVLRRFGSTRLRAQGSSMLPAIRPGDDLLVRRSDHQDAEPGDVIAFNREGRLFLHRMVRRDSNGRIVTQGDSLSVPDAAVHESEFLGNVTEIRRAGKTISFQNSFFERAAARVFRRSQTCAALFLKFATAK